jgi:hypothetical protein
MLKIKDNVDLKELEKFGFKRKNEKCYEYLRILNGETAYRVYTTLNHQYIQIQINLAPMIIASSLQVLLYDLIKANLVEKVGE